MTNPGIQEEYGRRYQEILHPLALRLEQHIQLLLKSEPRVDRISARAKSIDRFCAKAAKEENGKSKYSNPFKQIQDQVGCRIVTFYLDDVERIAQKVNRYFRHIENRLLVPESDNEFGYVGRHFILFFPEDLVAEFPEDARPTFFELQIKTLFQHAWSEANHDLAYKPESPLSSDEKRKVAFTAAQAWGADRIFSELFGALTNRRPSFEQQ